jgi:thymidylate synthase
VHLKTRNVNTAFRELVTLFHRPDRSVSHGGTSLIVHKPSRVGEVLQIDEPVTITYTHPRERVLFNAARDANCFFHLYESLWMLAGRADIAPLAYYSSGYAKQVQDGSNPDANGAYGRRWRRARTTLGDDAVGPDNLEVDQVKVLVDHLRVNPGSRRAVLQMWNVEDDLLKVDTSKDVCCNTAVYLSLRKKDEVTDEPEYYLDMTVTNRSNDLVWGTLGANVVHFSFLQEYMAAHLGCEVGVYNQFTNNLHVYTERFEPEKWLGYYGRGLEVGYREPFPPGHVGHAAHIRGRWEPVPLVKDPTRFNEELPDFVEAHKDGDASSRERDWDEPFFEEVAAPMLRAFHAYKKRGATTMSWAQRVKADDWRIAATQWLERRLSKKCASE